MTYLLLSQNTVTVQGSLITVKQLSGLLAAFCLLRKVSAGAVRPQGSVTCPTKQPGCQASVAHPFCSLVAIHASPSGFTSCLFFINFCFSVLRTTILLDSGSQSSVIKCGKKKHKMCSHCKVSPGSLPLGSHCLLDLTEHSPSGLPSPTHHCLGHISFRPQPSDFTSQLYKSK